MEQKENNMHEIAEKTKKFMNIVSSPGEGKKQGQLFIIDEQPPVGDNTTIMLHLVYEAAIKGRIPSAYFSPDLSNVQVVNPLNQVVVDGLVFRDGLACRDYIAAHLKALAENLGITIFAVED